jgi:hypothetical protein
MAEHGYLREYDQGYEREDERERERGFMLGDRDEGSLGGGDYRRGRTSFTAHPDAHYLNWRDRHMRELDRDYDEYRRERELQFHRDFSAWRHQRHGNPQPLQPGMTQSGLSGDPTGELQLETEAGSPAEGGSDPMSIATLGTNSGGR